jgi:hypothetical protein
MVKRALWLPIFFLLFLSAAAAVEANTYSVNDNFESPATIDNVGWTFSGTASRSIAAVKDGSNNANNNALSMAHPASGSFTAKKTLPTAITSGNVTMSFDFQRSAQVADYFYVYNSDGSENFRILIQGSNGKGFNLLAPGATKVSPDVTSFLDSTDTAIQSVFGVNANIPSTWVHLALNIDMTNKYVQVSAQHRQQPYPSTGEINDGERTACR